MFLDDPDRTIGFGLYKLVSSPQEVDDRLLFKIQELNFTLHVELYSLTFDNNLEQIVRGSIKQLSMVDTEIIKNNAPSTLIHQIENSKEVIESYTTSYGTSQKFMDSFSKSQELGIALSHTT